MTSPTKLDNRIRIHPELWKAFVDKCANQGLPYKQVLESLIALYLSGGLNRPTTQEHILPTPIPQIANDDVLVNQLMSGDLFS